MSAKLRRIRPILPWALLGIIGIYLVFAGGWKDVTLGRMDRIAAETFLLSPSRGGTDMTRAEIYLLSGSPGQASIGKFFHHDVYRAIELTGEELTAFAEAWEAQTVSDYLSSGMCHNPPYGFRLYSGSSLVREVSICWTCRNFQFHAGLPFGLTQRGFNPDTERAKALLAFCDQRLPYFRPPENPPEKESPAATRE